MAKSRTVSGAEYDSGFADHPSHTISIEPVTGHFVVRAGGAVIVEVDNALILREADYPPVYYFPRDGVDMTALRRSDHTTWCPFKGRAAYYSIGGGGALENAVWSYEDPFEEAAAIKNHLAFYPDRVEMIVELK